jgi:hypothetical protein
MKQFTLSILVAALAAPSVLAQGRPPIPIPGLGECPESCVSIRAPNGALMACCGEEEGCVDCGPDCVASCPDGKYGGCTDLGGGVEENCSKGCETFCDSEVSAFSTYCIPAYGPLLILLGLCYLLYRWSVARPCARGLRKLPPQDGETVPLLIM